ncbi:FAD-binding oxidoreductase [Aquimarina sp. ERC-38]|uniref:NAD(P)/FAD-dependent oxidoreductase n=1 Tax=Aquimarina sp. ERC-38 TaxID=2949996 RepID=UPI0022476781|nr:FAD-dependent oxidoreductase [Aquimarina sp. ERC-38]UZO81413.1 FAD-binding oxidoreductase [Aquimarina sp. ERC-38]
MKVDYIIVGFGLVGMAFCEQLEQHDKSYLVFDNFSQQASKVAGGLYNPVVLKRFTPVWNAQVQLPIALRYYSRLERLLKKSLQVDLSILRRFHSIEEQNLWFESRDHVLLKDYLAPTLVANANKEISAPYQLGRVEKTGKIKIAEALGLFEDYLREINVFHKESFDHAEIDPDNSAVFYKGVETKHIVFSEGFGMKNNPYFAKLPMVGNKGEYLIIRSMSLNLREALKFSLFIIPLGDDLYKVGATYNNQEKNNTPTVNAKEIILQKLEKVIKTDFTVVEQMAGVRPTVKDRRPLVGTHHQYANIHLLNGMGSRGILAAPWAAEVLFQHIENQKALPAEIDINRFTY